MFHVTLTCIFRNRRFVLLAVDNKGIDKWMDIMSLPFPMLCEKCSRKPTVIKYLILLNLPESNNTMKLSSKRIEKKHAESDRSLKFRCCLLV